MVARGFFDEMRVLAFGGISGAYAVVGSALTKEIRAFSISNNTKGDMIFTNNTSFVKGTWFVKAGGFELWDVQSNINPLKDDSFVLPVGTQFSVKQVTAPIDGAVYISILY